MIKDNKDNLASIAELAQFLLHTGPRNIHLIGVAGSGMSGLAGLLLALGHRISGSDKVTTNETDRLSGQGLVLNIPHRSGEVGHAELVVYSSAIRPGNVAFDEAKTAGKPMALRAEVLAAVMLGKKGIIVSGMHGKTTTSAMAAHVLGEAGLNPSHYVGAEVPILGTNARWSSEGDYFVAEGDESDGTLVNYTPEHTLVLNIEPEHLDFYKTSEAIDLVFQRLINQTKGLLFYWADDLGAARLCANHPRAVAVGTDEGCDYRYVSLKKEKEGSSFEVVAKNRTLGRLFLSIPGTHNVNNAMLVIALALELGVSFEKIVAALDHFRGAKRRFELKYQGGGIRVFDDYGHHPTEIAATLSTAHALLHDVPDTVSPGRLLVMFQPHRYSRTAAFQREFGTALLAGDTVFVTDIYPANEQPLPGVTGENIVDAARSQGHPSIFFEPHLEGLRYKLGGMMKSGDLILSLGAGNIHEEATRLVEDLKTRDRLLTAMGRGSIQLYELLSRHTTMRVGGPAQFWAEPETEEGFAQLVKKCFEEKIPLMVMGRGSNLIVRDGGIPGVVVHLARGCFAESQVTGQCITAGVGVKLKQLSSLARQSGLAGFEWMEGIPGNLGGGLRMNAGAMGKQTFEQVVKINYVDQEGTQRTATPQELEIFYRDVPFLKNNYVLSATLQGSPGAVEEIDRLMQTSWHHRRETQPIAASAGCTFKNPSPEMPAGRLIEELGLKNCSVGKARVSEIHGNFIVNDGGATTADVLALIEKIKNAALQERGIKLETEVQIVGVNC
ncbi:MAG: UDP-N-acetylmuramate--L-alanine ligase [Chthoniobacterales bacterium]|nr:UDP-N-acetylmuramate--L-alanine ligase [Chthoniobacterales bacterium]